MTVIQVAPGYSPDRMGLAQFLREAGERGFGETHVDGRAFVEVHDLAPQPSGRAVCQAFVEAMRRFGVPSEVLTDNGKQFTGRYSKPLPVEVKFERVCRENGINQRLTKPRSPTTTGKIGRFHKTLRREMLDHSGPFADTAAAQAAIDAWVHVGFTDRRSRDTRSELRRIVDYMSATWCCCCWVSLVGVVLGSPVCPACGVRVFRCDGL